MMSRVPLPELGVAPPNRVKGAAGDQALLSTLLRLAMIVEARDPYTGGHLWRVSQFSRLLAQEVGLSSREVALAEIGGFLHDLGKIAVPTPSSTSPAASTQPSSPS